MKKAIRNKLDPGQIFRQAERFNEAYKALTTHDALTKSDIKTLGPPAAVVSALSCELFLKCLICIETGEVRSGHDLKDLYDCLSASTRKRIDDLWNAIVVPLRMSMWNKVDAEHRPPEHMFPSDLSSLLVAGSQTFVKMRYLYEGDLEKLSFFLSDLPLVLKRVAIELKPELERAR